jgi:hypothetical protein
LFESIENVCRINNAQNYVKRLFGGVFSNQIICENGHTSERAEDFLVIPLDVKDKQNLSASMKLLVEVEYAFYTLVNEYS